MGLIRIKTKKLHTRAKHTRAKYACAHPHPPKSFQEKGEKKKKERKKQQHVVCTHTHQKVFKKKKKKKQQHVVCVGGHTLLCTTAADLISPPPPRPFPRTLTQSYPIPSCFSQVAAWRACGVGEAHQLGARGASAFDHTCSVAHRQRRTAHPILYRAS